MIKTIREINKENYRSDLDNKLWVDVEKLKDLLKQRNDNIWSNPKTTKNYRLFNEIFTRELIEILKKTK